MNKRPLVIGFGNALRGDDAAGFQVARDLIASGRQDINVLAVHQLTPELAANIADASLVLFIDATLGARPGEVAVHALAPASGAVPAQTHSVTPAVLLTFARELFGCAPAALLITIAGESFDHGEHLSESVRSSLPGVFSAIERVLAAHANPMPVRAFAARR